MRLTVLGCAAGIGGREQLTTCLRLDHDILLDAGTGLGSLGIDELIRIDHVFLSHCHLDHVAGLALLLDTVVGRRAVPITLHATPAVLAVLREHLFNWSLWPDFTRIPSAVAPLLRMEPMTPGSTVTLGARNLTSFPVNHTVDACAYWVHNATSGILFTGDMASTPALWSAFHAEPKLARVIVDCSFPNAESDIANLSKHFCPQTLIADLRGMPERVEFFVYHLKPGQEELIMEELHAGAEAHRFAALRRDEAFDF